jgi:hypothetical protein
MESCENLPFTVYNLPFTVYNLPFKFTIYNLPVTIYNLPVTSSYLRSDLASKLSATPTSGRRFIIAQTQTPHAAADFRSLVRLADDKEAMVVLCDPTGSAHVQHMMG